MPPLGGQLHDIAHNPPMFLPHPGVVNAVVVPHPAVYVAGVVDGAQPMHQIAGQPPHVVGEPHVGANQQGIGAQPRNQGAGQPPHVVGLPNVGADQQGRGIREVMSEMLKHLLEVENRYLSLHALLIADGEPVPADAVIEPNAFQMVNNTERLEQRDVERYRVLLSETYARFAREDSMLVGFMRAVFEMHARFLFLLDVHMNARNRAA
ncbi:unnamed protein product [Heligmosomoides polygyrus]|uniref:DH domain-containing protein n=1 Tax=Heligmosomoides polygyrus TaxID=6339 RepID=A0A3P8CYY9_HELPZ|nr:unnamed protein product [Heligmosomoides polygyrus]